MTKVNNIKLFPYVCIISQYTIEFLVVVNNEQKYLFQHFNHISSHYYVAQLIGELFLTYYYTNNEFVIIFLMPFTLLLPIRLLVHIPRLSHSTTAPNSITCFNSLQYRIPRVSHSNTVLSITGPHSSVGPHSTTVPHSTAGPHSTTVPHSTAGPHYTTGPHSTTGPHYTTGPIPLLVPTPILVTILLLMPCIYITSNVCFCVNPLNYTIAVH